MFGCFLFFGAAIISLPWDAGARENGAIHRQADSPAPIASPQKDEERDCEGSSSGNDASAESQATPERANDSQDRQAAEKSTGACPQKTQGQQSLLYRILRFFVSPTTSRPNLDVDTNISAGGAGGG